MLWSHHNRNCQELTQDPAGANAASPFVRERRYKETLTKDIVLQVGCSFIFFPKAVSWMHLLGGVLVVLGMCLFMQRPKDQDIQKVRQSPKVIDISSKEAAVFNDFRPAEYQIRAVYHKPVEWVAVPSRPVCQ